MNEWMKNCIVKIIENVLEKMTKVGYFLSSPYRVSLHVVKGNPSSSFSKTLLIIFTIQFLILFSETLIISQTRSRVSQNNMKYKSISIKALARTAKAALLSDVKPR